MQSNNSKTETNSNSVYSNNSNTSSNNNNKPGYSQIKLLGEGAFGKAYLVETNKDKVKILKI